MCSQLRAFVIALLGLAGLVSGAGVVRAWPENASLPRGSSKANLVESYGRLPLAFERNEGQYDARVTFLTRSHGLVLLLTKKEIVLALKASAGPKLSQVASPASTADYSLLHLRFIGSNPLTQIIGEGELPGKSNYFIGNDPKLWRANIANYTRVRYRDIYPGVDLVYYGNLAGGLEHDFIVRPGADLRRISLALAGASKLSLSTNGDLTAEVGGGWITLQKPMIHQEVGGVRKEIAGGYVLSGANRLSFDVPSYDRTKPLVIDPVLSYSSYLGGNGLDDAYGLALDSSGNAYVAGWTLSTDFPVTAAAYQTACPETCPRTLFVAKVNPQGTALIYSTYIGPAAANLINADSGPSIALDASGNAYITSGAADGYPTTVGAFQTTFPTGDLASPAFVTELNADGTALVYSSYFGGDNSQTQGTGIGVDGSGSAYITGVSAIASIPTTGGSFQETCPGGTEDGLCPTRDGFVTKFTADGSSLEYSTYLGGSTPNGTGQGQDQGLSIVTDSGGNAFVTGFTDANDFPTTSGAFQSLPPTPDAGCASDCTDAFAAKLNPTGSGLVYSTYLGGSEADWGNSIALDSSGSAYVTGSTSSADFPVIAGAFLSSCTTSPGQPLCDGIWSYLSKLTPDGAALAQSTYFGSSDVGKCATCGTLARAVAVDAVGSAYIAGESNSIGFPFTSNPYSVTPGGFITKFDAFGLSLIYSTYLGGQGIATIRGLAVGPAGDAYVTGQTLDPTFPVSFGAFQTAIRETDFGDAFISRVGDSAVTFAPFALTFSNQGVGTTSPTQAITLSVSGNAALVISGIAASGDFAQSNTCGAGISGNSSCVITVTFMPTVGGRRSGTLTVSDNARYTPHVLTLSGTGLPAVATASPATLTFPSQVIGTTSASKVVTLTASTGVLNIASINSSGGFVQSNQCPASLAAGSSCTISVNFGPNAAGVIAGALTISDGASNSPQVITLSGTGLNTFSVSQSSFNFNTVTVGATSSTKTVSVLNNGNSTVGFSFVASSDYAAVGSGATPCGNSLGPKGRCTIAVTFRPTQNGTVNGALTFTSQSFTPILVALTGAGAGGAAAPLIFSPSSLTFPAQALGFTSPVQTVTATNKGTGVVNISGLTASTEYAAAGSGNAPCSGDIAPGAKCTFDVTFTPVVRGLLRGAVAITNSSAVSPRFLNLSGTGLSAVSLSPSTLSFPATTVNASASPQTVTMVNNQPTGIGITSITASGQYAVTPSGSSPCGTTLAPQSACTFDVSFTPSVPGKVTGAVTVTHTAAGNPQEVGLTGTGIQALGPNSLGTVVATATVPCSQVKGGGGVAGGTCYKLTIACPGVADEKVALKVNSPVGGSVGTILFTTGGGSVQWYDLHFLFGVEVINEVVAANFTAAQLSYQFLPTGFPKGGVASGWMTGPGGPRVLACRWATAAAWVHDNIRAADSAFCATGNSGGAGAAAYALSNYGQGAIFDMLEETSGPPFSRVDRGCMCNAPPIQTPCRQEALSECYLSNANKFIDPSYDPLGHICSSVESNHDATNADLFVNDSLLAPDANRSYPGTDIHFVFGGQDNGPGVAEAMEWAPVITGKGPITVSCVANAPHKIADTEDGAQKVISDLIQFCHR